jgi:pyridoxal phosphate enzyme (YggS family)
MNDLKENLHAVNTRVETACADAGREPSEISVLAVSKKHPVARIQALHRLGQRAFGENRIQEALPKIEALTGQDIEWHFIGPLQSNKTREAAAVFDWVQSVDREKILRRLAEQRPGGLPPLNILIQVNIDRESQKSGVSPEQARALAESAASLDGIRLRGLMAIPQAPTADQDSADSFRRMRELFQSLQEQGLDIDTLSMGMSADLESAIMHGSTMVRIGTDLLGPRPREAPVADEPTNRGTQSEC